MELLEKNKGLATHLQDIFGNEYNDYLGCFTQAPPVSVRISIRKSVQNFDDCERVNWCPQGVYLKERPSYIDDPMYHAGAYYPQEASSMFLDYVLKQLKPKYNFIKVLDLSAAPGGKTLILSDNFADDVWIVANEVIQKRSLILKENITRWGCPNVVVTNNDPGYFSKTNLQFDLIVVDAPCSGEGMFRKDNDSINEWSLNNVELCSARQQRILGDIVNCLSPGGILIYSTCTFNLYENESNVKWLQERFGLINIEMDVPDKWNIHPSKDPAIVAYRFYPHKVKGEGLFLSVLQKPAINNTIQHHRVVQNKKKFLQQTKASDLTNYFSLQADDVVFSFKDSFYLTKEYNYSALEEIVNQLKVIHLPNELGVIKGKDFIPAHALALNSQLSLPIPSIEVDRETAIKFLRKEFFTTEALNLGWYKLTYNGLGMGFVKIISHARINNYLPEPYRIKKQTPGNAGV